MSPARPPEGAQRRSSESVGSTSRAARPPEGAQRRSPEGAGSASGAARPPEGARRTVLITGAAKRLGRAIALAFARHGWRVALHCHQSTAQAEETAAEIAALSGGDCGIFPADLSDEAAGRDLARQVIARYGQLDAVVNNASRFDYDHADSFRQDTLLAHLGPNLIAPIALAQALAEHIRGRPQGSQGVVINLLDQKLWNYNPDFFSYTLTKAALHAATTMLAQGLAPAVRVAGVAPGLTLPSHLQTEQDFQRTHALAPLGKASSPEDVATAVLFLAETTSITGSVLLVDGGQHLVGLPRDFSML